MVILLALACAGDANLTPEDLLTRASLDLRGVRPTAAELEAAEDADTLEATLDAWLLDERLGDRVVALWGPLYRTRVESFLVGLPEGQFDEEADFYRSVGEEPLRLLAEVARSDLPWTTIATADWSMGDERLAALFPIDYPAGEVGWRRVHYQDGRPAAGVLTTNGLWWRFTSTKVNANRGRANVTSRVLLCDDLLARDVSASFDLDILDEASLQAALREDPSCTSCHAVLDPLSSFFFGFYNYNLEDAYEAERYHPQREPLWRMMTGSRPAYFGAPMEGLSALGQAIAADPRFVSCAVEQAFEVLLQRPRTLADTETLDRHRAAFEDSGLRMRALLRSILDDPRYRGTLPDAWGGVSRKLVSAELLASQVEALTGFRWIDGGVDSMTAASTGFAELAGAADGLLVDEPARVPGTTLVLVQERLAEAAAAHAVSRESSLNPSERQLFSLVELDEDPSDDALDAQLALLRLAVLGQRVDDDTLAADRALWEALRAAEGAPAAAWQGQLTYLLRTPDFVLY